MADYSRRHIRRKLAATYQSSLNRIEQRIASSSNSHPCVTINESNEAENKRRLIREECDVEMMGYEIPPRFDVSSSVEASTGYNEENVLQTASIDDDDDDVYRYSDSEADECKVEYDERTECDAQDLLHSFSNRFRELITNWAIESNITHTAVNKLLKGIRHDIPELLLPLDSRTLLKTPRYTFVSKMGDGHYCHYGTNDCVEKIVEKRLSLGNYNTNINLLINVDGLPLGKSSEKNLWPILCSEEESKDVYIIGIYAGQSKPKCPNQFLKKFVDEMVDIVANGLIINKIKYNINLYSIICDAPAKAYILCVKSHNAYYSCTKCTIEGEMYESICYPGKVRRRRTDEEFRELAYVEDYQKDETVLNRIPRLGLVSSVPLDIMHLVYLGCCRKLLYIWMFKSTQYKLPAKVQQSISSDLLSMSNYIPCDFARKPRDLKYIKFFKATEFRLFLLYTGPVVLKRHVDADVYLNFVTLHVAITILCNSTFCKQEKYLRYAEQLLEKFVEDFGTLYGNRYISHNIHNLQHIVDDVRKYGNVEINSAFRFENFLGKVKSLIRKGEQPLQQLSRRFAEMETAENFKLEKMNTGSIKLSQQHFMGPLVNNLNVQNQYLTIKSDNYKLKCDDLKNSFLMIDNKYVVRALNFIESRGNIYVVGKKSRIIGNLYDLPMESSVVGVQVISGEDASEIEYWEAQRISKKLCRIPFGDNFVVVPVLHT